MKHLISFFVVLTSIHGLAVQTGFLEQQLDHFSANPQTFKQRFHVESQYAKDKNSPVIFFLGLEEGLPWDKIEKWQLINYAKKLNAHLVVVEHRYYGESSPVTELTGDSLKYLTWRQALYDYYSAQKYIQNEFQLSGSWIAMGASYGGTLAAYYATLFPEMVKATLASSAVFGFFGPIANGPIWNSESLDEFAYAKLPADCQSLMTKAIQQIDELAQTGGLAVFKSKYLKKPNSDEDFLAAAAQPIFMLVQYGFVDHLCSGLKTAGKTLAENYFEVGSQIINFETDTYSIAGRIRSATEVSNSDGGTRQFAFQHCSGTNPYLAASPRRDHSVLPSIVNLAYQSKFCTDEFGLTNPFSGDTEEAIIFDQLMNKSSNILFLTYSRDMWSTAGLGSVCASRNSKNQYIEADAAHSADMYPEKSNESSAMQTVRSIIAQFLSNVN
jgi:pimeloyl-ACP methyl ester carboxylesterase